MVVRGKTEKFKYYSTRAVAVTRRACVRGPSRHRFYSPIKKESHDSFFFAAATSQSLLTRKQETTPERASCSKKPHLRIEAGKRHSVSVQPMSPLPAPSPRSGRPAGRCPWVTVDLSGYLAAGSGPMAADEEGKKQAASQLVQVVKTMQKALPSPAVLAVSLWELFTACVFAVSFLFAEAVDIPCGEVATYPLQSFNPLPILQSSFNLYIYI